VLGRLLAEAGRLVLAGRPAVARRLAPPLRKVRPLLLLLRPWLEAIGREEHRRHRPARSVSGWPLCGAKPARPEDAGRRKPVTNNVLVPALFA
jgi:hypothetical protein